MKAFFHVTDLDQLIWFNRLEDMTTEELVARLRRESAPGDKMLIGTAWHNVLEDPPEEITTIERHGFTFRVDCDAEIILPQVREIRATRTYLVDGVDVTLTGGCDGITGLQVDDHKLTFRPDPENYFESYQWRAYLSIFGADVFQYHLYHAKEDNGIIVIKDISSMKLYRYPGMEEDLITGIGNLVEFAKDHLPEKFKN